MFQSAVKGADLWNRLAEHCSLSLPEHLRNILSLQEMDEVYVLKFLPEDFSEMQDFVRSEFFRNMIPPENADQLEKYYGEFVDNPGAFVFHENEVEMLRKIVRVCKEKPDNFWCKKISPESRINVPVINNIADYSDEIENWLKKLCPSTMGAMMFRNAVKNEDKDSKGHRYEENFKRVCCYYLMVMGPIAYQTLSAHFPFPKMTCLKEYIYKNGFVMPEGTLQIQQLKKFLTDRKLKMKVFLSEDATRVTGKVQYDCKTNQLVGFVLPTNENSMPICHSFPATSADIMKKHFDKNKISTLLYTFIAQPIEKNPASFCLCLFGTDNSFTCDDVLKRWKYIGDILRSNGIEVMGYASDGDSRLLKAMRIKSGIGKQKTNRGRPKRVRLDNDEILPGFCGLLNSKEVVVQDTPHIVNRLRTRIFNHSILLPIGTYLITSGHIRSLYHMLSKDKHFLTEKDVLVIDKMNFASTMRYCHPRIVQLLADNVPASEGTQAYLRIMYYITISYLSTKLNLLQRVYCAWYSIFFLRVWRYWLRSQHKKYDLQTNFITLNAYMGIEIDGHSLINLILHFLDNDSIQDFHPWQYGSQGCEGFYRNLRSMSTTHSTVVNSTVLESMHKIRRLNLQSEIMAQDFEAENETIPFPRMRYMNPSFDRINDEIADINTFSEYPLNRDSIKEIMMIAKNDAMKDIQTLGINPTASAANNIMDDVLTAEDKDFVDEERDINVNHPESENEVDEEIDEDTDEPAEDGTDELLNMVDYSNEYDADDPMCPVTKVKNSATGITRIVKKTTYCWLLQQGVTKLSNDRLLRVQQPMKTTMVQGRKIQKLQKMDKVYINDWCLFKIKDSEQCLMGHVTGFTYITDSNKLSDAYYRGNYANIENNTRKIGIYCDWFNINEDRSLQIQILETVGYIELDQYELHVPTPRKENGQLRVAVACYPELRTAIYSPEEDPENSNNSASESENAV